MTILERLKERKSLAEINMDKFQQNFSMFRKYERISYLIYVFEMLKCLSISAPLSMNPKKVHEHFAMANGFIKAIGGKEQPFPSNLILQTVNSYSDWFKKFIQTAIPPELVQESKEYSGQKTST